MTESATLIIAVRVRESTQRVGYLQAKHPTGPQFFAVKGESAPKHMSGEIQLNQVTIAGVTARETLIEMLGRECKVGVNNRPVLFDHIDMVVFEGSVLKTDSGEDREKIYCVVEIHYDLFSRLRYHPRLELMKTGEILPDMASAA